MLFRRSILRSKSDFFLHESVHFLLNRVRLSQWIGASRELLYSHMVKGSVMAREAAVDSPGRIENVVSVASGRNAIIDYELD